VAVAQAAQLHSFSWTESLLRGEAATAEQESLAVAVVQAAVAVAAQPDSILDHHEVSEVSGTDADDILVGTAIAERINGNAGNDTIDGNGGNDSIFGDAGDDRIICDSGDGSDVIDGGEGNDTLVFNWF
jgi:RTX calcium-binding nonapeptide repeat (4 copies)